MIEDLLKAYDTHRKNFHELDNIAISVMALDAYVKRIRELESENADLKNELRRAGERY